MPQQVFTNGCYEEGSEEKPLGKDLSKDFADLENLGNHGSMEEVKNEHLRCLRTNKNDRESVYKVSALHPEGYLLKTMEPASIVKAIDDFFEKQKWNS